MEHNISSASLMIMSGWSWSPKFQISIAHSHLAGLARQSSGPEVTFSSLPHVLGLSIGDLINPTRLELYVFHPMLPISIVFAKKKKE
ncbi:hypothetical protein QQP08_005160 [Theobroma cacao]|nr:hypothetical protein QQP08_005160 [Theobroma cacao]